VRRKCGEEPDLSASLLPCTLIDTIHLSMYLGSSTYELLVKLSLHCYSFAGSRSVPVVDTLVEGPSKRWDNYGRTA
jgi:hypothetical protein